MDSSAFGRAMDEYITAWIIVTIICFDVIQAVIYFGARYLAHHLHWVK